MVYLALTVEIDTRAKIAFSQLRFFPRELKITLARQQLWEDVQQTLYAAAVEAERHQLSVRETSNLAQRSLYQMLRDYGFRRQRSGEYVRPEIPQKAGEL